MVHLKTITKCRKKRLLLLLLWIKPAVGEQTFRFLSSSLTSFWKRNYTCSQSSRKQTPLSLVFTNDASTSASTRALISPWKRAWCKHKHKRKQSSTRIEIFLSLCLRLCLHRTWKRNITQAQGKSSDFDMILKEFLNKTKFSSENYLRKSFVSYCVYFACLDSTNLAG